MINEEMTPMQVLQVISGLCKTNGKKKDWHDTQPEHEFNFIANMIDSYVEEQDKGSEGANQ